MGTHTPVLFTGRLLLALLVGACSAPTPSSECGACSPGSACVDGVCSQLCNSIADCGPRETCEEGACLPIEGECARTSDCPEQSCQVVTGCSDESCTYEPLRCETPPANACAAGVFTTYSVRGSCDAAEGACAYPMRETACADCEDTCLAQCEGVVCDDFRGGCRTAGFCVPGTPATCEYESAPSGTDCTLDEGGAGQCYLGDCVVCPSDCENGLSCTANAQCVNTCVQGTCADVSLTGGPCDDVQDCVDGHLCSDGLCKKPNQEECLDNSECIGSCVGGVCADLSGLDGVCDQADSADCQSGHTCVATTCKADDGLGCGADADCVNRCIGGTCAPPSGTAGTCDPGEDADCASSHACSDGVCLRTNGAACESNEQCVGVCIDGTCAPVSSTNGPCDETADCAANHTCNLAGACKLNDGQVCTAGTAASCLSGHCSDGFCCDAPCSGDCDECSSNPGTCTLRGPGHECRPSRGECDPAEHCTGSSNTCPTDVLHGTSQVCRPSTNGCDPQEVCNGSSPTCPTNVFQNSGRQCVTKGGTSCQGSGCFGAACCY